ncbi:YggS family pyridoxal phosphate-dependent enzyme [bacterium]|nr:YggS family pyridoxal phosphate-dependent enzyme [bacterium]
MTGGTVTDRLAAVRESIATACARAGRCASGVRLVAVSKRVPLPLVLEAARAGQRDFGENRVQDALARQDEVRTAVGGPETGAPELAWHFIGHLQRNKAARVAGRFALVHGVDSVEAAARISRRCEADGTAQALLLEVNISGEAQKDGLDPATVVDAVGAVAGLPGVDLQGLMGMARFDAETAELGRTFARLRTLAADAARQTGRPLPELSMGMSDDYEVAIAEGATIVRVGSAIFGPRPA